MPHSAVADTFDSDDSDLGHVRHSSQNREHDSADKPDADVVPAAGAVVWRDGKDGKDHRAEPHVVLIHRPRYDDWTLPKGKLDEGECLPVAAAREVAEETGLTVRLGLRLGDVSYAMRNGQTKRVAYWAADVRSGDTASYRLNDEIDGVEWLALSAAMKRVSYDRDRSVLTDFAERHAAEETRARPLVVLRHAEAKKRTRWRGDDRRRTLTDTGLAQAEGLVAVLAAWGVKRVLTSDSARCVQTVLPYTDEADVDIALHRRLTEEDADRGEVRSITRRLFASHRRAVLCTHRPVLPWVFDALGRDDPHLDPGGLVVLHRRDGRVVASERHLG